MDNFSSQSPLDRAVELLPTLCEGMLDADATRELESLVTNHKAARRFYVRYMFLHARLHEDFLHPVPQEYPLLASVVKAAVEETNSQGTLNVARPAAVSRVWRRHILASSLAVAAVFYGVFWLSALGLRPEQGRPALADAQHNSSPIAVLTSADDCLWSAGGPAPKVGASLDQRPLRLEQGLAEVQFDNGARVTLEGPCTFTPVQAGRGQLKKGRLVAYVPARAIGFTLDTDTAQIVDLGTEFGVAIDAEGASEVQVFQGEVEVRRRGKNIAAAQELPLRLGKNAVARVTADGEPSVTTSAGPGRFGKLISNPPPARYSGPIALGNLFDDEGRVAMADAMVTDTFAAVPEYGDLGIHLVRYGGESVVGINRFATFDFKNLGWSNLEYAKIANDAWTAPGKVDLQSSGIRTQGTLIAGTEPKIEDGIGMHSNAVLTFDLDQIRIAAGWQGEALRFVCDRAGINDDKIGAPNSYVHMAVLVTDAKGSISAYLQGKPVKVERHVGAWRVTGPMAKPLKSDGQYVAFDVDLPVDASYLTLAVPCAWNGTGSDHAVWSGARLEVRPKQ